VTLPRSVDLGNFAAAWEYGHFGSYMLSSLAVTVAVVALSTVLAVLAGFAFAFPGSGLIFFLMLGGHMLPAEAPATCACCGRSSCPPRSPQGVRADSPRGLRRRGRRPDRRLRRRGGSANPLAGRRGPV
jgi:hypothetical protein